MRIAGSSPQGRVALIHFLILLVAFSVRITFFPVRPNEATPQQVAIFESASAIVAILSFPLGYLEFLLPTTTEKFSDRQLLWPVLIPLNSALWGYSAVWTMRRVTRLVWQQTPPKCGR